MSASSGVGDGSGALDGADGPGPSTPPASALPDPALQKELKLAVAAEEANSEPFPAVAPPPPRPDEAALPLPAVPEPPPTGRRVDIAMDALPPAALPEPPPPGLPFPAPPPPPLPAVQRPIFAADLMASPAFAVAAPDDRHLEPAPAPTTPPAGSSADAEFLRKLEVYDKCLSIVRQCKELGQPIPPSVLAKLAQ